MPRLSILVAPLLALVIGCASPAETEITGELTAVDRSELEGQLRFLDRAMAPMPLPAEMVDEDLAVPVEVGFHSGYAVAWWAPEGVGRVGHVDSVVFAWRAFDTAEPIDREVESGSEPEVRAPAPVGHSVLVPDAFGEDEADDPAELPTGPTVYVDWLDEYTSEFLELWGGHPGCL